MRAARVSPSMQARISSSSRGAQCGKDARSSPRRRGLTTRSSSTAAAPRARTASAPKSFVAGGRSLSATDARPARTAPLKASSKDDLPSVRPISLATEAQAVSRFLSTVEAGTVAVVMSGVLLAEREGAARVVCGPPGTASVRRMSERRFVRPGVMDGQEPESPHGAVPAPAHLVARVEALGPPAAGVLAVGAVRAGPGESRFACREMVSSQTPAREYGAGRRGRERYGGHEQQRGSGAHLVQVRGGCGRTRNWVPVPLSLGRAARKSGSALASWSIVSLMKSARALEVDPVRVEVAQADGVAAGGAVQAQTPQPGAHAGMPRSNTRQPAACVLARSAASFSFSRLLWLLLAAR